MVDFARQLLPVNIEDEMRQSYMDYAMSVIVGRALPDVRDGLKPVHRRALFTMHEVSNDWNKPYKKSARIVGEVMGKYHPHGDSAIYDTIVRMAQPFSLRYMLVDGQGNFGSVDGDAPAAMRYTEVRMSKIAHELLADIDKETVDFQPNYDGSLEEPMVFPTRFPNLLVNGSSGIAVGMATNIPPHNLTEVTNACIALIDDPDLTIDDLMRIVPGPDFPTAGIINGAAGIREAYRTGRGRIYVRAKAEIENGDTDMPSIVITELPYQVNKARLLEKIAELVKEKKIEGIRPDGLRDESDKDGMRVVIELKRGESAEVLLNNLYLHTQMQSVFGINTVALVEGQPRTLDLKTIIQCFIRHRREVVTRRTIFDLRKARERAHVLEGLAVALANIDPIIALIKASPGPTEAKAALVERYWEPGIVVGMLERAGASASRPDDLPAGCGLQPEGYRLSDRQAKEILDMRLQRLTALEQDKIVDEFRDILVKIEDLLDILRRPERLMRVIRDELVEIRDNFGDARRTRIEMNQEDVSMEDLIAVEDVVVTLSHAGYAKSQPIAVYRSQRRGGKGKTATTTRDEDFVDKLFVASTHDTILCFSTHGKLYWLKVYELPQAGRTARGRPLVNLLPLVDDERISAILPVKEFVPDLYVFMATRQGIVKKTPLTDFSRPRTAGIIAVDLDPGDSLVGVALTDGSRDVMLVSSGGKAIRFSEQEVRAMGRNAHGVRGIRLGTDQLVIAMLPVDNERKILLATEHGYGKRTKVDEFPLHGRGGQGVIAIQTSKRNGDVVGAAAVGDDEEIMLISDGGTLVRTPVAGISIVGRNTQGVRLISLSKDEKLVGLEPIAEYGSENGEMAEADDAGGDGEGANGDSDAGEGGDGNEGEAGLE
ncbi:MAG: DNA gyrase subunit A [Gammaproteobacteria bacterium]|nr:DNA gyrase subunit A [Gammaproteobacteria bacterium]MBI5614815.1 DNA gyrase subunit A [Gammaproteobacteria bacterium]